MLIINIAKTRPELLVITFGDTGQQVGQAGQDPGRPGQSPRYLRLRPQSGIQPPATNSRELQILLIRYHRSDRLIVVMWSVDF